MKTLRLRWLVSVALAMTALLVVPHDAVARGHDRPATCWVKNTTTLVTGSNLSAAVDAADAGDTLKIRGVCGPTAIDIDLTMTGPATLTYPVCEGYCGAATTLTVGAGNVTLRDLTITGGESTWEGGGIHNSGTLILAGTTSVTGNWAEDGGGGILNYGTLIMTGASSVTQNSLLGGYGGGVLNHGLMIMTGASSVTDNPAIWGGGIANHGTLIMNRRSSVTDNTAEEGGGIYNYSDGTVIMRGRSSITGNTADTGGGILNEGTVRFARRWKGTVCGNDPDDWPRCPPRDGCR